ncbi:YopX family protein [Parasporobacterium paucivorans]|uniref:Phage uncharacterized protein TIGR01671 n=1 Tax=Parasporobacterium paucivorans DSM 15970 TaxID=1122934 RepID=A0A1M6B4F0_9FIRM|nr:YopX family protein [Parasporobacterium paucivorans]SHI43642.1 phage uncharacterized protein TIGR01671 [Parasporobacterium paucivorans DSM 15970]
MSRQIKFRAWEKNLKEIIPVYNINFETKMMNCNGYPWRCLDEIELMQYTGLHDTNGKEIYEGDIVSIRFFDEQLETMTVVWSEEAYGFRFRCEHNGLYHVSNTRMHVIGNIYENPELIQEDKQ